PPAAQHGALPAEQPLRLRRDRGRRTVRRPAGARTLGAAPYARAGAARPPGLRGVRIPRHLSRAEQLLCRRPERLLSRRSQGPALLRAAGEPRAPRYPDGAARDAGRPGPAHGARALVHGRRDLEVHARWRGAEPVPRGLRRDPGDMERRGAGHHLRTPARRARRRHQGARGRATGRGGEAGQRGARDAGRVRRAARAARRPAGRPAGTVRRRRRGARRRRCREPARPRAPRRRRASAGRQVRALLAHAPAGRGSTPSDAVRTLHGGRRMSDPRLRQAVLVAILVVVVDQLTKAIVERTMTLYETIPLLPVFSLTYVRNTGAAFGMLSGAPAGLRLPLFPVLGLAGVLGGWLD